MADDFDGVKDLFEWNRSFFVVMGVWPLEYNYATFVACTIYLMIQMSMEFSDLYLVFGNLDLMILNLTESTLEIMIIVKMLVMRFSKTLVRLMTKIMDGVDGKYFATDEEKEIYLNYNRIAKYFFKLWFVMGGSAGVMYHIKPLEFRLRAVLGNETVPYVLTYRTHVFFEVDDSTKFWLIWIYQLPMIYINWFHTMSIAYIFSMVLHVCGLLSVLAFRIKNLHNYLRENSQNSTNVFRNLVKTHRNIMGIANDIDKVFHLLLLEELFISTVILGLTTYSVLLNADFTDITVFLSFFMYTSTLLVIIYGYCVAGEYLITESVNVCEAYYQCQWYDLSEDFKKQLIICIIGASKPLRLTGGGIYVFSLASFTSILKTAMGYMSMLRTIL